MTQPVRFMANNSITAESLSDGSTTVSSAQADFPASNLGVTARSKVWAPAGNFEVANDNGSVYINDGSDKTIDLVNGFYAGPDALASHIETELNSASSGWTISYDDADGRFVFNHASATIKFTSTTNAAWDMLGYTETSDVVLSGDYEAQERRNHTDEWIKHDAGVAVPLSSFALIGPLSEALTLSSSAQAIKLQANNVDNWNAPPFEVDLTYNTEGIYAFVNTAATSYRYWRLYFQDRLNPIGPEGYRFGVCYIGDYTTVTSTNVAIGFSVTRIDPSQRFQSENGQLFFNRKTKYKSISSLQMQNIPKASRLELQDLYNQTGTIVPFFISMDPAVAISENIQELTRYVIFDDEPIFNHLFLDYYSMGFGLRELL